MAKKASNYDKICVSEKTRKGMSLTSDDIQYLIRMLTVQDDTWNDAFDINIKALTSVLSGLIADQNKIIKTISDNILEIKSDIIAIKERLGEIEDKVETEEMKLKEFEDRLEDKRIKIEKLQQDVAMLNPELVKQLILEIKDTKPILGKLVKYSSRWNTFLRIALSMIAGSAIIYILHHYFW